MVAAEAELEFPDSGAPLSVLLDFDGTVSLLDVGDELLERHGPDATMIAEMDRRYDAGEIGSRALMRWDMDVLPRDAELLLAEISSIGLDEGVVTLVDVVRAAGGVVEIVSDGIGVHVEPMLDRVGLGDLPISTNRAVLGKGGEAVTFPYGHPECHVCGTCKRERVRLHAAAGRVVVFVGDGTSDRYAAHHADVVFAKGPLAAWCEGEGIAHEPWERLVAVASWIEDGLSRGRLPRSSEAYERWRLANPLPADFICGPEVWDPVRRGVVGASSRADHS